MLLLQLTSVRGSPSVSSRQAGCIRATHAATRPGPQPSSMHVLPAAQYSESSSTSAGQQAESCDPCMQYSAYECVASRVLSYLCQR
jgi:hypothetical protein